MKATQAKAINDHYNIISLPGSFAIYSLPLNYEISSSDINPGYPRFLQQRFSKK